MSEKVQCVETAFLPLLFHIVYNIRFMFNVIGIVIFFPWQYSVKNVPLFNHWESNEQRPAGADVAGEGSWSVSI